METGRDWSHLHGGRQSLGELRLYDKSEHRPGYIFCRDINIINHRQIIINHPQLDNIHGMKIVQNIDERRNIVVTQQFQKACDSAEQVVQNDNNIYLP